MAKLKQIGMAAGTFSVALGIGFVMQNGDAVASRFSADANAVDRAPFTAEEDVQIVRAAAVAPEAEQSAVVADTAPEMIEPQVANALDVIVPEVDPVDLVETMPSPESPAQDEPIELANLDSEVEENVASDATLGVEDCVPAMTAAAGPSAMIDVTLSAPCYANASFTTHHQGMMFTVTTDDEGQATYKVPALAEVAVVIAAFDNGDGAVSTIQVPDFANFDRAVLQWQGDAAVMLSAYEGDAAYGEPGHIHAANPGDMTRLDAAEGGYLMSLGAADVPDALKAEVYTFPSGTANGLDDVMLVAEAEITDENCGSELNAQSIQVAPSGATSALDLVMTMPECDAVGDVLILQNMFEDLTLASR